MNCDDGKPFSFTRPRATATGRIPTRPTPTTSSSTRLPAAGSHDRAGDHGLWTSGIIGGRRQSEPWRRGRELDREDPPDARARHHRRRDRSSTSRRACCTPPGFPRSGPDNALGAGAARADHQHEPRRRLRRSRPAKRRQRRGRTLGRSIVASAGNDGSTISSRRSRRRIPSVMAVAAVGMDGALATYSNAGTYHLGGRARRRFPSRRQRRRRRDRPGLGLRDRCSRTSCSATARRRRRRSCRASPRCCLSQNPAPHRGATALAHRAVRDATGGLDAQRHVWMGNRRTRTTRSRRQNGPVRQATIARLVDATTGAVVRTDDGQRRRQLRVHSKLASGSPTTCRLARTRAGDGLIGVPGRRFTIAGGLGNADGVQRRTAARNRWRSRSACRSKSEPNDDVAHANMLTRRKLRRRRPSRRPTCATCTRARSPRRGRTRSRPRDSSDRADSASSSTRSSRVLGDDGASSARTTTSTSLPSPLLLARAGAARRRGSTTSPSAEARSTSRSPRRTGAIDSRFAQATSGGKASSERTAAAKHAAVPFQHQAFGFALRYFSSQPWTSPHHSF